MRTSLQFRMLKVNQSFKNRACFENLILGFWCGALSLPSRATGSLACWHSQTAGCTTGTCNPTANGVYERSVTKNNSQRDAS